MNTVLSCHGAVLRTLIPLLTLLACNGWYCENSAAESAIDRLSGFDLGKIAGLAEWCDQEPVQPSDATAAQDVNDEEGQAVARFLYQVQRFSRGGLNTDSIPAIDDPTLDVGDLGKLSGKVIGFTRWVVPPKLAESIDMPTVFRVKVELEGGKQCIVVTPVVPEAWLKSTAADNQPMHLTKGAGVVIRGPSEQRPAIIGTAALAWMVSRNDQSEVIPDDWRYLSEQGLDLTLLETVRQLDRKPLQPEDGVPFFSLFGIAAGLPGKQNTESSPLVPASKSPMTLLKESKQWVGRYVRIPLQTVRLTRVGITDADTKKLAGADHYWQLDCIGDLGNAVVKIDNGTANPAVFENRFPISVVVRELPQFLRKAATSTASQNDRAELSAAQIDTALVSTKILVEGFYYRLWSYENQFMKEHGGGNQFGPLIIASQVQDDEPPHTDLVGAAKIGWFIAIITGAVLLAVVIGGLLSSRRDAAAKRRQLAQLPPEIPDRNAL